MIKNIILKFLSSKFYVWLMKEVIPKIRFTMAYSQFSGKNFNESYKLLKPGHFILTADPLKLTGMLVPGYDHLEFCVYKDHEKFETIGMHSDGLRKSYYFDVCKETKSICILEAPFDQTYIKAMINKALGFIEKNPKYDLKFSLNPSFMYCSELGYHIDFEHRLKLNLTDIHALGQKYISPQGFRDCPNLKIIFESK